jgi:hypothetical protein
MTASCIYGGGAGIPSNAAPPGGGGGGAYAIYIDAIHIYTQITIKY